MTAAALLDELRLRGVRLARCGGDLQFRAPRGALTPDLKDELRHRKRELLSLLAADDGAGQVDAQDAPPPSSVRDEPPPDEVAAFKALDVDVKLRSERHGELWLVPSYTSADRLELSIDDFAVLQTVLQVFPGAEVVSIAKRAG